jgi:hypothetical protein
VDQIPYSAQLHRLAAAKLEVKRVGKQAAVVLAVVDTPLVERLDRVTRHRLLQAKVTTELRVKAME